MTDIIITPFRMLVSGKENKYNTTDTHMKNKQVRALKQIVIRLLAAWVMSVSLVAPIYLITVKTNVSTAMDAITIWQIVSIVICCASCATATVLILRAPTVQGEPPGEEQKGKE